MKIALATVGTTGDVLPFRALARRLVARGHEVTVVTWPVHRAAMSLPGIRVEVAGPHADPARIAAVAADAARHGPMGQVAILRDFHLADGEAHLRRLRSLLPEHDLVLLHAIHSLAHAAVLDDELPWATVAFDPVLLPTATAPPPGMPNLGPGNRLLWYLVDRALARTGRPLDAILSRAGSEQRGLPLFRARSPRLHLVACSPSIITVPDDLPTSTRVTGRWEEDVPPAPLPEPLAAFLDDGPAPVTITFGSMAPLPEPMLAAVVHRLLDGGRRVVSQTPTGVSSPNLIEVGAADHRALFPRSAVALHHGGAGTSHAACAAGIPSVVVPQVGDQRYWADRLAHLGLAPAPVPVDAVPDRLADALLETAADPRRRQAAQALAARIAGEHGLAEAVRLIESLAH